MKHMVFMLSAMGWIWTVVVFTALGILLTLKRNDEHE